MRLWSGQCCFWHPESQYLQVAQQTNSKSRSEANAPGLPAPPALLQHRARVPAVRAAVELHGGRHDLRVRAAPVLVRRVVDAHVLEPRREVVLRLRGRRQAVRLGGVQVHLVDARDHLAPGLDGERVVLHDELARHPHLRALCVDADVLLHLRGELEILERVLCDVGLG